MHKLKIFTVVFASISLALAMTLHPEIPNPTKPSLRTALTTESTTTALLETTTSATKRPSRTDQRICYLKPVKGTCYWNLVRYSYNIKTRTCETFTYSGCGGNANRFQLFNQCMRFCRKATSQKTIKCNKRCQERRKRP